MSNLFFDELQKSEDLKEMASAQLAVSNVNFPAVQTLRSFLSDRKEIALFGISNVAKIVANRIENKKPHFRESPNIAPAFPKMWFEYLAENSITEKDYTKALKSLRNKGILPDRFREHLSAEESSFKYKVGMYITSVNLGTSWLLNCLGFVEFLDRTNDRWMFFGQVKVLPNGALKEDFGLRVVSIFSSDAPKETLYRALTLLSFQETYKVFYAMALMHCKNISIEEVGGKPAHIKNRRHRNKGTRHHVLKIIPMKKVKAYQEKGASSLSKGDMSLHIRRGHFKTYSPEAPLFGVHSGTYWWEAHTAGKAEAGNVTKDYQINPPGE
ncbi:hypothetical protein MASR2M66_11340 [Chloroflexota bacterium]